MRMAQIHSSPNMTKVLDDAWFMNPYDAKCLKPFILHTDRMPSCILNVGESFKILRVIGDRDMRGIVSCHR